jgi:LPPG:FO 2-phospho-L-lactate transferase
MAELGIDVTARSIAVHYAGIIDGLVIDDSDAGEAAGIDLPVLVARTLMQDLADRKRLAGEVVAFASTIGSTASKDIA